MKQRETELLLMLEESDPWVETAESGRPTYTRLQRARVRRIDLHEAMESLEATVARPAAPEGWAEAVVDSLLQLRDALQAHIRELEAPDGLFAEILDKAPRLASEVEALKKEHIELAKSWARALQSLRGDGVASATEVRRRVISLIGRLAIHRHRGSDLVYEAYNVDIAAAD
ncbi:MAG TPA: hypothetical protein VI980_06865 [Acidimicrobiia bacterium]|nr:hypothetical protein [Acidimicrobiia bacterium]HLF60880.1 hypothetical protein [Acidimicrobiia bacterium]